MKICKDRFGGICGVANSQPPPSDDCLRSIWKIFGCKEGLLSIDDNLRKTSLSAAKSRIKSIHDQSKYSISNDNTLMHRHHCFGITSLNSNNILLGQSASSDPIVDSYLRRPELVTDGIRISRLTTGGCYYQETKLSKLNISINPSKLIRKLVIYTTLLSGNRYILSIYFLRIKHNLFSKIKRSSNGKSKYDG